MGEKTKFMRIWNTIQRYRLLLIMLAACLTIAALMTLVRVPWATEKEIKNIIITEQDGIYDLTGITDWETFVARLEPGSVYYPNTYLMPGQTDIAVAESISRFGEQREDYLSQRFVLKMSDHSEVYTLRFELNGRHAMRVYVNGALVGQTGELGTTKQSTEVWENHIICHAAPVNGEMDIILHSAQFYHAKRGATLAQLSIEKSTGQDMPSFGQIRGLLVTGVFLGSAVLLFSIYFLFSKAKATLYFAIACSVIAIRECLQSQAWTLFPIPGNLSFMLEYLTMVLLTIFLSLYLGQFKLSRWLQTIRYTTIISSMAYGVCVLFGDALFYTSVLIYYQVVLLLCCIPGILGLFFTIRFPTKEQSAALYGIAVFYLAAFSDILIYSDLFGNHPNLPILETAMLVFVLAQTVSLCLMNNRVLAEAREAEHKLEAEKYVLEELNRMKTEFLGNVSHEFKTPLTVMSGYAQTTRQLAEQPGELDAGEVSRRMQLISSEAERLSLLVGQTLDITRIEEGRMAIDRIPCYMDEIIHRAIQTHYPVLNKNSNRLEIHMESGMEAVNADPARISQVIINLISNAVRFTVNGLITVSARREDSHILVCVSDTGAGISQSQLPHIFERYNHNSKKSGTGQDTGTGLGLYICKYIVEQHGGRIWIESVEGKGTSAFFTLPNRPFL